MNSSERRRVARAFKMRGLSIQTSALDGVMNVLRREKRCRGEGEEDALSSLLDEIKSRLLASSSSSSFHGGFIVTEEILSKVVSDMSRDETDVIAESMQLLDAFNMPRLFYDTMSRKFELVTKEERSLFGNASHKVEMLLQRYELVRQRILRHDLFRPKLVTADGQGIHKPGGATHALTPMESLLGRSGVHFLLGMIVQVEEGRYYLEDHTSQVAMDLSQTSVPSDGFITENCVVLVEGEMIEGILRVHRMGNPLIESRIDSINAMGLAKTDIFHSISTMSELDKLREQEDAHGDDGQFVLLSDVHLDNPHVMEKLEHLFEGFQALDRPLPIFIFMGNFTSKPLTISHNGTKVIMGYWEDLASTIEKFPKISKTARFVFVPGPDDPGISTVLPRPPIPAFFTNTLRNKVPHAIFATNPCRIRYFTREIVLYREDVVQKLWVNSILPPRKGETTTPHDDNNDHDHHNDDDNTSSQRNDNRLAQHAVKTILDQGHLSPLPLSMRPIYWQYDHTLRLYPLPDAVIVGDRVEQFYENYSDCDVINPGPFPLEFSFVVYRPVGSDVGEDGNVKSDVEMSQIH